MSNLPSFSPEEFAQNLGVIQKTDPVFLYKTWQKSAVFFQAAAEANIDITEAILPLQEIYRDSNNVEVMKPVAYALIRHFFNKKEAAEICALVQQAQYPSYYLLPIGRYFNSHPIPPSILELLVSFIKKERFVAMSILVDFVKGEKKDQKTLVQQITTLFKNYTEDKSLLTKWLGELSLIKVDLKPHLELLVESLNWAEEKNNSTNNLVWAVESGVYLDKIIPKLMTLLEDDSINNQIAYCLSYHYVRAKDFEALDFLLQHPTTTIQTGGLRGLAVRLSSSGQTDYILVHLLLLALTSPNLIVQNTAYNLLSSAKKKNTMVEANEKDLFLLVTHLGSTTENEVIIPYLISCIQSNNSLTKLVLDQLVAPINLQIELQQICTNLLQNNYSPTCSICESIPRDKTYNHESDVPEKVSLLEPKQFSVADEPILRSCPECANRYSYETFQEYENTSYGTIVKRLFIAESLSLLKGQALMDYQDNLSEKIKFYKKNLAHINAYLRDDAIYALVDYYFYLNDPTLVVELINHKKKAVVRITLLYIKEHFRRLHQQLNQLIIQAIEPFLSSTSETSLALNIQLNAATIFTAIVLLDKKTEQVIDLLESKEKRVQQGAFEALSVVAYMPKIDFFPYQQQIIDVTNHPNYSIRSNAQIALHVLLNANMDRVDFKPLILEQLKATDEEVLNQGLKMLRIYIDKTEDYFFAIEHAGKALQNHKLSFYALLVLKESNIDLATGKAMLPYLKSALKQHQKDYIDQILFLMYRIYDVGVDLSDFLPEIAIMLNIHDKKFRSPALQILTYALKKGVDLSFAEKELLEADLGQSDSYDQDITYILTNIYLRAGNSKELFRLFSDENRPRRGAALNYLNQYPNKSSVNIEGFIEAVISGIGHDFFYINDNSVKAVEYFKNRSEADKKLMAPYLK